MIYKNKSNDNKSKSLYIITWKLEILLLLVRYNSSRDFSFYTVVDKR